MSAYVIVEIEIHDPQVYDEYKAAAPASISQYGGRYVARGGKTVTLEGNWDPKRIVVLEFPSLEQARAWWAAPEYSAARAIRQRCASTRMIVVEGVP